MQVEIPPGPSLSVQADSGEPSASVKRSSSPSDSDQEVARPQKKRRDTFPRIPRSERCGECENCLNPQRKKACIKARARLAALQQQQGGGADGTAAPVAAATSAVDPFIGTLQNILAGSGGVTAERHAPSLLKLLQTASTLAHRSALLTVLQLSTPAVLHAVVKGGGAACLEKWLAEGVAAVRPRLVGKLLAALAKMPITLSTLRAGELGKMVGRLRKNTAFDDSIQEQAKSLVAAWKHMVDAAAPNDTKPVAAPVLPSKLVAQPVESRTVPADGAQAATPQATDLFAEDAKQREAAAARQTSRPTTIRITTTVTNGSQTNLEAAAASKKVGSSPLDALSAFGDGPLSPRSPRDGSSSFTYLGGDGGRDFGDTYRQLTAAERAAAAAERVPSPEPVPRKPKTKSVRWGSDDPQHKNGLQSVRWFLQADPPAAASADASTSPRAVIGQAVDATFAPRLLNTQELKFESAAKREHLSEADALRAHRQQEDAEHEEMAARLAHMEPRLEWRVPLPDVAEAVRAVSAGQGIATGEESTEIRSQKLAHAGEPRVAYASVGLCPLSAEEPASPWDKGESALGREKPAPTRIPISLDEAAAWLGMGSEPSTSGEQAVMDTTSSAHAEPLPTALEGNALGDLLRSLQAGGAIGGPQPGVGQFHQQQAFGAQIDGPRQASHLIPSDLHQHSQRWDGRPASAATGVSGRNRESHHQQHQGRAVPSGRSHFGHHGGAAAEQDVRGQNSRNSRLASVPCKFFNSRMGCRNGSSCPFLHVRD